MHPNLWQYAVLLEGVGAAGVAAGVAHEALRRDPLDLLGYAHIGILLVSVSVIATIAARVTSHPTVATWIGGAGFALYIAGAVGSYLGLSLERILPTWRGGDGATRA